MYSISMLMSTFARRLIVEYKTDELVTVLDEFSSLPTFTVTYFTAFILFTFLSTLPLSFLGFHI